MIGVRLSIAAVFKIEPGLCRDDIIDSARVSLKCAFELDSNLLNRTF